MSRPKIIDKRKSLSISINIELDDILNKICKSKCISKTKYIEYLIKKDIERKNK